MNRAQLFDAPPRREKPEPELVLSFRLKDKGRRGERPIADVFGEALEIIGGGRGRLNANWLATVAVRAVCEAVIRQKGLPVPLAVDLRRLALDDVSPADDGIGELRRRNGWTGGQDGKGVR